MAAQEVFNTPELLEAILLNLRVKSILKATQVNRTFRTTFNGSLKLQRRCWMVPKPHDPTAPTKHYNFNRMIDDRARSLGLEPPLQWKVDPRARMKWCCQKTGPRSKKRDTFVIDIRFHSWDSVMARGRSCDRMLVIQPPHPVRLVWSVGFYYGRRYPSRRGFAAEKMMQCSFQFAHGHLPTLEELKETVVERFGVMGRRFDVVE
ncbi:hypothetical protein LTR53_003657 [Teratosphaeriaceae sp. CCFEE 6253]|nr:hypothetical protein LTR53_003657 [Teratosphaeriaceae sp. CCFEE 6253]